MQDLDKKTYVELVTEQIRCKKARELVAWELEQHIEDQAEALLRDGMEAKEAQAEAVRQMGDPVETGTRLDGIHRPRLEWRLLLLAGLLAVLGLLFQYAMPGEAGREVFGRQAVYTLLGIGAMAAAYFADYTWIGKYPLLLFWGFAAVLTVFLWLQRAGAFHMGMVNGRYRMYALLILFVPLYAGVLYRFRGSGFGGLFVCGLAAAFCLFLALGTNSRTAVWDLFAVFAAMLTLAVWRGWFAVRRRNGLLMIWGFAAGAVLAFLLFVFAGGGRFSYVRHRLLAAVRPEQYAGDMGYTALRIRELLENVRLTGGPGLDPGTAAGGAGNILSERMLLYVSATFGVLAGIGLTAVLGALLVRLFSAAFRQKNQLGSMLTFGCACLFFSETLVYVQYNMGCTLFSPMYLPFLSASGIGTVTLYFLLGLMLSVYRNTNLVRERRPGKRRGYRLRLEKV